MQWLLCKLGFVIGTEALTLSIELAGQVLSMCAIALRKFGLEEAAAAAMGIPPASAMSKSTKC